MTVYALEYMNREGDLEIVHFTLDGKMGRIDYPHSHNVGYEFPDIDCVYLTKMLKSEEDGGMVWYEKLGTMAGLGDADGGMTAYEFMESITEDDEAFKDFVDGFVDTIEKLLTDDT